MKPLASIALSLSLIASSFGAPTNLPGARRFYTFQHENVLGTAFELKVQAGTEAAAQLAETAALNQIEREAKILSGYDSTSEFSRWTRTRGQAVPVSPELFEVLAMYDRWRTQTNGALDAAAEAIGRVWKAAATAGRLPTTSELQAAVAAVHQPHWRLDPAARTATHLTATPLMLNSFTKSYIIGHAADAVMHTPNVTAAIVNIGGDLVVRGAWTEQINLADPRADAENSAPMAELLVRDRAVATSGDYRRGYRIGGRSYSHIVDPRTGRTADDVISSTVVSSDPATAGALATAFSVLTPAESARLAATLPGVEYLLVEKDGARIASPGWHALEKPQSRMALALAAKPAPAPTPAPTPQAGGAWDPAFELTINLELARLSDMRARRPYVAIWIEDKDKFPVRTLGLWFEKPRWLPELRAWNRDERVRSMAEGNDITPSISSATRPPGKYSLKWDGKDNGGKPVKAGKYTICIEVTREHGTYQIIRQEMDFAGAPKQVQLQGNEEVAGASLDYNRRTH